MPLPSRRKGEERSKFVSRCVSFMTKKGEGKDTAQRVAICNSRANYSLTDEEMEAIGTLWVEGQKQPSGKPGVKVTDLSPTLKKKKRDKYRITKEDGSGTDDTAAKG